MAITRAGSSPLALDSGLSLDRALQPAPRRLAPGDYLCSDAEAGG